MFVLFCLTTQNMFSEDSGSKKNHFDSKFIEIKPVDLKKDSSFSLYADEKLTFATDLNFPFVQLKGAYRQNQNVYNFGASGFTEKFLPMFPCSVQVGNLSESGSLSKLKSPLLSGGNSPFSVDFASASSIYSSLPSSSSFSKPLSTFVQAGYKSKASKRKSAGFSLNEIRINGFYTPQSKNIAASTYASSSFFQNKIKISASFTAGDFFYQENDSSSWFLSDFYFPDGRHFCSLSQITAEIPHYKISFSQGLYENAFGNFSSVFRLDNLFSVKNSSLTFSCYFNPNSKFQKVLSSSQTLLQDVIQLKSTFTRKFIAKKSFIKIGILAYTKMGLSDNFALGKLSFGAQITNPLFSVNFYFYGNSNFLRNFDSVTAELEDIGFNFSNKWYFSVLSPAFSASSTFSFSDDYNKVNSSSKFSLKLAFLKNPKVYSDASYSFSTKNSNLSSQNMQFSISSTFIIKNVKISGSLGWKVDL